MSSIATTVLDGGGEPLDATYDIEAAEDAWDLVFHRGLGSKNSPAGLNTDYFPALEILLGRLAAVRAEILVVMIDSRPARSLDVSDRVLPLEYPVRLEPSIDIHGLRLELTRHQPVMARAPTAKKSGGNSHKRIRIRFRLNDPVVGGTTPVELLSGGQIGGVVEFGSDYREANAEPTVAVSDPWQHDPVLLERGLASHAMTQNLLRDRISTADLIPRSPNVSVDPNFDIAWRTPMGIAVCEVKSLTRANEEKQLRLGLGQVLRYRYQLSRRFPHDEIVAILAVEREPSDGNWLELCSEVGVVLSWPPEWDGLPGFPSVHRR